jgi:hypothetical protein
MSQVFSLVCWSVMLCCEGPPPDALIEDVVIEGIDFAIIRGAPSSGLSIAPDDPRLPMLKEHGLVRQGPPRSWGCEQAAGEPNTEGAGDIVTAWASATPDGQDEWLELTYAEEIKPVEVHVVETYNPGALFKVTAATGDMEAVLWKGEDPTARDAARGTSIVKVSAAIKTNKIRIHLASKDVPGWNEIDAVGIKDETGKMHWAKSVVASSNYAGGEEPGWVLDLEAVLKRLDALEKEVQQLRDER